MSIQDSFVFIAVFRINYVDFWPLFQIYVDVDHRSGNTDYRKTDSWLTKRVVEWRPRIGKHSIGHSDSALKRRETNKKKRKAEDWVLWRSSIEAEDYLYSKVDSERLSYIIVLFDASGQIWPLHSLETARKNTHEYQKMFINTLSPKTYTQYLFNKMGDAF